MLEKQFERFLAEQLIKRCQTDLKAGFRYQFNSPDSQNSQNLVQELWAFQSGQIHDAGTELPYLQIGTVKLLPVLHADNQQGFTENYISRLRDLVAAQQGQFECSALLIVHNSMLDTLINSAEDLAQAGKVWHPNKLKDELKKLINPLDSKRTVSETLLELVYDQIVESRGTAFGFSKIYKAILDGDLRFDEIGLLHDSDLNRYEQNKEQIQKRLLENQQLHDRIAEITERFPEELVEKLGELDFGEKFIEEHFF